MSLRFQLAVSIVALWTVSAEAAVIYVDQKAGGTANGTTWPDAFTGVVPALAAAKPGDEVWVAGGTHEAPIALKAGVRILGGFTGVEKTAGERSPSRNLTILTGNGDHRVIMSEGGDDGAVVDGFRITDGFVEISEYGGAMELRNSEAAFVDCEFLGNHSVGVGGAVVIWSGSPRFERCRFLENTARGGCGAVFTRQNASPTFVDCLFARNQGFDGGAVCNLEGAATFVHCTFADNEATSGRGAALFDVRGEATIERSILWNASIAAPGEGQVFCHPQVNRLTRALDSDIQGGWPGDRNSDVDPKFLDPVGKNLSLQADSPARLPDAAPLGVR